MKNTNLQKIPKHQISAVSLTSNYSIFQLIKFFKAMKLDFDPSDHYVLP